MIAKTKSEIRQDRAIAHWRKTSKPVIKPTRKPKIFDYWKRQIARLKKKSYREFLQSEYWNEVRIQVFKRDNKKCTVCGNTKELQVHHTTYKNHFEEHKNLQDLITLCRDCHKEYHNTCEMPK